MKYLNHVIEEYLKKTGQLSDVVLGDDEKKPADQKNSETLAVQLDRIRKSNNYFVITAIAVLLISLTGGLILLWLGNTENIKTLLTGMPVIVFGIVAWLRRLWIDKVIIDMSLVILHRFPPEQAAPFISNLYWRFLKKSLRDSQKSEQ